MDTQVGPAAVATMLATAMVLSACGATESGPAAAQTRDHPDIGTILVDPAGKTLYFTDQEEGGDLRCVDDCLEMWLPAESPADPAGVDGLGMVKRTDNARQQLTYEGKPLYTFQLDESAGDAKGHDVEDDFGGTHFVWHAVTVGTPAPNPGGGGGYEGGY